MTDLSLQEWRTYTPESEPTLAERSLSDASARGLATDMARAGRLKVLELRNGLQIETTSYVGAVRLGDLRLTIRPKLEQLPLITLLRYAYGLRDLELFETLPQGVTGVAFHDLLIHQLVAEVSELLARGLQRRYEREEALLSSPRGRINFTALVGQVGAAKAALPCAHHPRQEDTLHNRAVLAGLRLGARLTDDLALRGQLRRLAALLVGNVTAVALNADLLRQVGHQSDRLTAAYRPALAIIELLLAGQGIALRATDEAAIVPGFLFDMNRFFQALISRFLHEHLTNYEVRDQHRLQGMMVYDVGHNPRRRRAPEPRPDFAVVQHGHVVAVLDAKYRDLWDDTLPCEMLYQLAIYALSRDANGRSVIIYPTLNSAATDARIEIRDPVRGSQRAEVFLRPLDMQLLAGLTAVEPTAKRARESAAYARWLAFGHEPEF
jgi:5-methylcytosine-specific restriction enzyme subunit McrC